ncbi:MAG: metal-sensitive transcriptional regulator [Negativicutes bacterium]|nr:metal-sensitive transcriptional regulator [Negativicutes bacterium]
MRRTEKEQQKLLNQLKKIEGQVRGIQRMLVEDRYCIDILIQVQAARAALTSVGLTLLESHAKGCVVNAVQQGDAAVIDELIDAAKKFIR